MGAVRTGEQMHCWRQSDKREAEAVKAPEDIEEAASRDLLGADLMQ